MKFQFSLKRLFVAIALICIGCAEIAFLIATLRLPPPFSAAQLIAVVTCLPMIGAGLFTPFKRPILGTVLGLLSLPIVLFFLFGGQD